MVARRERFSCEQIIEQVSVESVEIEEDEGLEVSFVDVLERSISEFNVLWPSILNFSDFKVAADKKKRANKLWSNAIHNSAYH